MSLIKGLHNHPFSASPSWRESFLHGHGFDPVKASNTRKSDLETCRNKMDEFMLGMREVVLKQPLEEPQGFQYDDVYGRFPKQRRMNGDQVPCGFIVFWGQQLSGPPMRKIKRGRSTNEHHMQVYRSVR